MPKNLVWLASYPKSGNTWLRSLVTNYALNREAPAPINRLSDLTFGDSSGPHVGRIGGKPHTAMTIEEEVRARPKLLAAISANGAHVNLVKTHSINARRFGVTLIPPELTKLAVYVVRHPLDMLLSYADHYGVSHEIAVEALSSEHNRVAANATAVAQFLGSWSEHVASWTRRPAFRVITVRYEDLHADAAACLAPVVEALGMPADADRLARAVRFSDFGEMRRQEEAGGFVERSANQERFFRSGATGQWREALAPELAEKMIARHGDMMKKHGYL